ncbi:MAG TPA: vanadium-dependent haloperoxidase [Pyrinomonadaceae bacterium]
MSSPSQFRAAGPPALTSMQYAADVNEVKDLGSLASVTRTADQTEIARFWNGNTPVGWNRIAVSVSEDNNLTLSQNSRLLALLNVAMADAVIACWEAKYYYSFWRPITAIRLADTDGNPGTTEDASWASLLTTPAHPDYPSGHATVSRSAKSVLAAYFGDATEFSTTTEILPNVTRSYSSFTQAVDEAFNARIYGGIHFRSACRDGQAMGAQVGDLVVSTVAQRRLGPQTKFP